MKSGMKSKSMLKKGLKTRIPEAPTAKAKGANINSGALRSAQAPQPRTLGPRTA